MISDVGNRHSRMRGLREGKHMRWGPAFCLGDTSGYKDRGLGPGEEIEGEHDTSVQWELRVTETAGVLGQGLNRNYQRRETPKICIGVLLNLWPNTKYWMHRARLQNANSTLRGKNLWKNSEWNFPGSWVPTSEGRETLLNTKGIQ